MNVRLDGYAYSGELVTNFEEALQLTRQVLAKHGFGVQSEIAISEVLKAKLGVVFPREVILGVCNPDLANQAIQKEPAITLLLPCNVSVREAGSVTRISAVNPAQLVGMAGNAMLSDVAAEADVRIRAALNEL